MPDCPICNKTIKVTGEGRWYKHPKAGPRCDASGTMVPNTSQPDGATSTTNPPSSARTPSSPESTTTPRSYSERPMTPDEFMDGDGRPPVPEPTDAERELAARIRETFYAYTNRMDRSQQSHLGPSEVGTPCDRRLALHVLGMPPVNPGGDNWASFKGTCVHAGLADMFVWADAATGRFAVEVPLALPSALVPRGTADLLDRTLCLLADQKVQGQWSLDKLRRLGPSPTHFVQVHLYAYAARRRGERVDKVCIVGWPIEESNLDNLVVWLRDYDPTVAPAALGRVERIAATVRDLEDRADAGIQDRLSDPRRIDAVADNAASGPGTGRASGDVPDDPGFHVGSSIGEGPEGGRQLGNGGRRTVHQTLRIASEFDVADDCRYCPYSAPDDSQREFGCNGKH